jgi:hypothetical protein
LREASDKMPDQDSAYLEIKETLLIYAVVANYNLAACYQWYAFYTVLK